MRTAAEEMNRRLLRARDAMDRSFVEPLGNKVGLELSADVDFGAMRWLTVRVPGDPSREVLCQKTYETLPDRGVEFAEEPTQQPYGIDCGARDPPPPATPSLAGGPPLATSSGSCSSRTSPNAAVMINTPVATS